MTNVSFVNVTLAAFLVSACGLPYVGTRMVTPDRQIKVTDVDGKPLTGYDLYVYRCTHPGSQFDRVLLFANQAQSQFTLPEKTEIGIKQLGGTWLAPDFYMPAEPMPYWVACVNKAGFISRRWSLGESQGTAVVIALRPGSDAGSDYCTLEVGECNACRSYEYFMSSNMRYSHKACKARKAERASGSAR